MLTLGVCLASCLMNKTSSDEENVNVLASFEDGLITPLTASAPGAEVVETPYATHGKKALKFSKGQVAWLNAAQNWQAYDFLMVDVYLEGDKAVDFFIGLYDKDVDYTNHVYWTRVNYFTVLRPGKNTFRLWLDTPVESKSRPGRQFLKNAITQVEFSLEDKADLSADSTSSTGPVEYALEGATGKQKFAVYLDNVRVGNQTKGEAWFDGLTAFSFGNDRLPVMGGFTRVTKDVRYADGKGYGWTDAQTEYALDPFQPEILYRSVIHVIDGDFTVDLPNGKYRVFMNIDGPAGYWGTLPYYRERQVLANGKQVVRDVMNKQMALANYLRYFDTEDLYDEAIFDKYITPHYQEKTFDVDVTDGRLTLSFKTNDNLSRGGATRRENSSIALSALIIYPVSKQAEGQKFLDQVKERRRADFDLTFRKVLHIDANPEPVLTPKQQAQKYVVFSRPIEEDIYPDTKPETGEMVDAISATGAAGTLEPVAFAIRSYTDFGDIRVTASDFTTNDGQRIPSNAIRVGYVSNRLTRMDLIGNKVTIEPRYLMNNNRTTMPANTTRWFWAIFDVPDNVRKGVYQGNFDIAFGNGEKGKIAVSFEVVYDQALPKMDIPTGPFGIEFSLPMWYGNELADLRTKLVHSSLDLMRKSGFTTFTSGLRLRPEGYGKDLKLNFEQADSIMNLCKAYGMTAFVNYGGGGVFVPDSQGRRLNVYGYPVPTDPKTFGFDDDESLWKHIIGLIDKHAREKQWLPVYTSTSDEPHVRADRENCVRLNRIFKKYHTPRVRFAGITSMSKTYMDDYTEAFCRSLDVANLNLHDQWAIDLLRDNGTAWAFYNGGNRWTFGPYMFMLAQKTQMLFRVAWHWNCNSGNPYYALDGREDDYCWVNIAPDGQLITSIFFERLRCGIVDYRYLLALRDFVAKQPLHPMAKEAKALLAEVMALEPDADRGAEKDIQVMKRAREYREKTISILKRINN